MSLAPIVAELVERGEEDLAEELVSLVRAATGFKTKAKIGDLIQSFHVTMPPDPSRGSLIGRVQKIEQDPMDGVEYVNFKAEISIGYDGIARKPKESRMRAPQNGTPTSMGGTTDGINILGR